MNDIATLSELDSIPALDNSRFHFDFYVRCGQRLIRCTNRHNGKWIERVDSHANLADIESWMEKELACSHSS